MFGSNQQSSIKRNTHTRLRVEGLEDRLTPSWGATPPASVSVPTSFSNVTLNSSGDATGTASISTTEIDWYKFSATAGSHTVNALTPSSNLDTVIGLYNASGQRVAYNDDFSGTDSQTSATLTAGTYYLGVTNYTGTAAGSYTWSIDGPTVSPPPPPPAATDDSYENNDTSATASNLGTLTSTQTISNLKMADAADFYKFTTTSVGTSSNSVSISFTHSQGDLDLRLFNASGTQVGTSGGTGNTETISLNGLAAGTYTVQAFGYNGVANPNYTLNIAPPTNVSPPPPPASGFSIQLRLTGMSASQQTIFQQAATRWAQVITGDLPNASYGGLTVDDLLIDGSATAIDGVNGILGQAGPDAFRSGSSLPYHGSMQFDTADLASLEASGGLYYTILHEMGHVLGIGTIWQTKGLLAGAGTSNSRFTGVQAVAAYNSIFGTNATSVPVETTGGPGTADGHWRETTFNNELMTGYLNNGANPLSRITVGSLADLGYTVNFNSADSYTPSGGTAGAGSTGGSGGSLVAGADWAALATASTTPAPVVNVQANQTAARSNWTARAAELLEQIQHVVPDDRQAVISPRSTQATDTQPEARLSELLDACRGYFA